jgi:hypothetical protein
MFENSNKIILDLCGGTGSWSKPYRDAGYDVRLITLPEHNIFTYWPPENVYGILAAPTCTHFSWCRTNAKEERDLKKSMRLVQRCLEIVWEQQYVLPSRNSKKTTLKFWALENPKGFLVNFLGKPPLEFSPSDYGDDYKKKTHIWGNFNIPVKTPIVCSKEKFDKTLMDEFKQKHPDGWVYDKGCGLNYRAALRSITPPGFAKAFFEANK